jgi:exonuclease V gamma subunit
VGWGKSLLLDSVIFTIIGALIALVVAVVNWVTSKPQAEKEAKRWHHHIVLLAAIFTVYGTWRGFLLSEEKTWQQTNVQFQNDWLQQKQHKERLHYERELRAKSDEIAALSKNIAASVTGGDSFCYVMLSLGDDSE